MAEGSLTAVSLLGGAPVEEWPGLERPCHLEYQQFLVALGVSPLASPSVLQVAQRAHAMPYPPNWSEELDKASGTLYFYHSLRDSSCWEHPSAVTFQEVLQLVEFFRTEKVSVEELAGRIEAALLSAQGLALEELANWVGPIEDGADKYFFNQETNESDWEDPRERWHFHLRARYDLLVGYLVAEERRLAVGVQASPALQNADITPTLTTLASSMSSMKSTLSAALTMTSSRVAGDGDGLGGSSSDAPWAKPRMPRSGCIRLPPRATDAYREGKKALFSMPRHQQKYAADVLHHTQQRAQSNNNNNFCGEGQSRVISPPLPPPGAPRRY